MARGHEEVSNNQVGRQRGTPREMATASSLVVAMSTEELRLYNQVPAEISLELSNSPTTSIIEVANNVIYFTREQFASRLSFPVPSLMKQFLHFTWAPPTLEHPYVFWILMGCSVLNSLYQLDISLVEICFIYTLKLGIEDLLKLIPGSSLQADSAPEPLIQPDCLPLSTQDPKPAQLPLAERDSQLALKRRGRRKRRSNKLRLST